MSPLGKRIAHAFSNKVYPNPNDPAIATLMEDGVKEFRAKYLRRAFPWVLNGEEIYPFMTAPIDTLTENFVTRDPADKSMVAYFPSFNMHRMDLTKHLPKIREAGIQFFLNTTWQQRVKLLETISEVAQDRFWLLCAAKGHEQGQQVMEQIGETDESVDFPLVNAWYLERLYSDDFNLIPSPASSGDYNGKRHVPHGVFFDIEPYNFPDAIPMDMATKALAMGNAVIMKPSPKSALSGYLAFETIKIAFLRCGIEWRGVVNYAPGGEDVVHAMLSSPHIAGASFTGSSTVLERVKRKYGKMLRHGFAGTMAPLVWGSQETSGVNPFVVCPDADPVYTALECVKAFVGRMGQKCSSARVVMVPDNLYDNFVATMCERLNALRYGDVKMGADVGAMATAADVEKLQKQIAYANGKGKLSTVLYEKPNCVGIGYDFPPTVLLAREDALASPLRSKKIMNTEYFGPACTIVRYGNLSDVEHLLRKSEFALTGSIFTDDDNTLMRLLLLFPAGNVYINRKCTGALVETECFGGLRSRSGVGIKGIMSLALFGSHQTTSGFYPRRKQLSLKDLDTRDTLKSLGYKLSK